MQPNRFRDRRDAGRRLAAKIAFYAGRPDAIVLALPRGGVPVAYEIARALALPLDLFLVRKLGVPSRPELAMGAVAAGDVRVINDEIVHQLAISEAEIAEVGARERDELARRTRLYCGDRPPPDLRGRAVILVDDGLATGATMRAAVAAARRQHPARLVVAVPTAAPDTLARLAGQADEVVSVISPEPFIAVGYWYEDFTQTSDDEVRALLARAGRDHDRIGSKRMAIRSDA
jgi:predicted phosphoribosyltransferase